MSDVQGLPSPADMVAVFNLLGYGAPFAAVAEKLNCANVGDVYDKFPNREVLGELWLCSCLRRDTSADGIGALFGASTFRLIRVLNEQRDFSQSWLAALRASGRRLQDIESLQDKLSEHYFDWMEEREGGISLPEPFTAPQDLAYVADAMSLITLRLVADWETDDTPGMVQTSKRVDATAFLLDGLLTSRDVFGGRGLLVHLVELLGVSPKELLPLSLELLRRPQQTAGLAQALGFSNRAVVEPLRGLPDHAKHAVEFLQRRLRAVHKALR